MRRFLFILFISSFILISFSCKKVREDRIIGTWYRINLESPLSKSVEVWNFTEYNDVKIMIINNYPKDTVPQLPWRYAFDSWKKIRLYRLDGSAPVTSYEILKLNKDILTLKNYDLTTEGSKEFVRDVNKLAIQ